MQILNHDGTPIDGVRAIEIRAGVRPNDSGLVEATLTLHVLADVDLQVDEKNVTRKPEDR